MKISTLKIRVIDYISSLENASFFASKELVTLKVKHSKIVEENETLLDKVQALQTDKNEFETTLTKLKVHISYPVLV